MSQSKKENLVRRIEIMTGMVRQLSAIKLIGDVKELTNENIDDSIKDLVKVVEGLKTQLKDLSIMEKFDAYPWVITQKSGMPWYFQFGGYHGKNVKLYRNGSYTMIPYQTFIEDYVKATEDEVRKHVNFMDKMGRPYMVRKIDENIKVNPIVIDFVGSLNNSIDLSNNKDSESNFFTVTLKKGRGCTVYHPTYEIAETEALRLSKQEGKKAYIMGVVGTIEAKPITTYEVKKERY